MNSFRITNLIRSWSCKNVGIQQTLRKFSTPTGQNKTPSKLHYLFLIAPATTFGLGTWQVFRLQWKEKLVQEMKGKTTAAPVELPKDLTLLADMNYTRVKVTGEFDHEREIHFGPRAVNRQTSGMGSNEGGYQIITPFKIESTGEWILINRGWVKKAMLHPSNRQLGQVTGPVTLTCIVRKSEQKGIFIPQNKPEANQWWFRDIESMASHTGTLPYLLDADIKSTLQGGPIGGQTKITIRNEHLQYIITWYGLSIATLLIYLRLRRTAFSATKQKL